MRKFLSLLLPVNLSAGLFAAEYPQLGEDSYDPQADVNTCNGPKRNVGVNERYGNPIQHGLPVLVLLGETGKPWITQETGSLEEGDAHNPAKILAFLREWAPRRKFGIPAIFAGNLPPARFPPSWRSHVWPYD